MSVKEKNNKISINQFLLKSTNSSTATISSRKITQASKPSKAQTSTSKTELQLTKFQKAMLNEIWINSVIGDKSLQIQSLKALAKLMAIDNKMLKIFQQNLSQKTLLLKEKEGLRNFMFKRSYGHLQQQLQRSKIPCEIVEKIHEMKPSSFREYTDFLTNLREFNCPIGNCNFIKGYSHLGYD